MKPVYFFIGAYSEEGFFSLYDQLLGGRLDDLMILKGGPGCGKSTFMRRVGAAMERAGERIVALARVLAENAPKHTYAPIAGASNPVQPTLS